MFIYPIQNLNYKNAFVSRQSFSSARFAAPDPLSMVFQPYDSIDIFSVINKPRPEIPWVRDNNILQSISVLKNVEFDSQDINYVQNMGVILPFLSGSEAVEFIKENRVGIKFAQLPSEKIHAQYDYEQNCILINKRYKYTRDKAEILAISEAILHEAGHAKDYDDDTSVQEEIDCLAMNALSHRFLEKQYPTVFSENNSPIIKDGVCIYPKLFFDQDPEKKALCARLAYKYGDLPAGDLLHSPSEIALAVKNNQG